MAAEHAGKLGEPLPQTARPAEVQAAELAAGEATAVELSAAGDGSAALPGAGGSAACGGDEEAVVETLAPSGEGRDPPAETPPATQMSLVVAADAPANQPEALDTPPVSATPFAGAMATTPQADLDAEAQAKTPAGPPLSLTCAAGLAIPLHNLRRLTKRNQAYAIYRGSAETRGVCVQRQACTRRTDSGCRREFGVPIAGDLLGLRDDILRQARAGRKGLLAPGPNATAQPAIASHPATAPALASRTPTPKPHAPTKQPRLLQRRLVRS